MVVACRFKASLSFQLRRFACERGASFPLCKCQASSAEKHHAMETWLKSKADQLAQAAQDHVSAVQQSASKLAVAFDPVGAPPDDLKDVEFRDGPLGFTLEGNLVVAVQPSSQAERLGVEIGDRLVKIDGYEVPRYETEFEEQRARKVIAKWLKEMPRPAILTFELQQDLGEEVAKETPQPRSEEAPKAGAVQVLQAELQRTQEERKKLAAELKDSQEACGQLSAQVESLKKESGPNLRRLSEMEEQLQTLRTQNKELVSAVNASSASRADEELLKLRQALAATQEASQAAVQAAQAKTAAAEDKYSEQQQEVKALMLQVADLTEQAESRRLQIEPMEKELQGFQAAHEAELDLFREEQAMRKEQHQQEIQELQLRLGEQQIKAERELQDAQLQLQKSKEALQEAQVNAEAAAVEATAARREVEALRSNQCLEPEALHAEPNGEEDRADPSPMLGDSLQVLELRKRINLLETRCATLQRRLRSQDAVTGAASTRPSWELRLAALAGPQVAAVAVALHRLSLSGLRGFTERLLKSEAWLWVFYAHLLVLYTISASCSVQTTADAGRGAVDTLNAQLAAMAGSSTPAATHLRGS
ncbi:Abhd17b [Symbiodinium sp. CCMP2592]|nr:Abhd17b [Symbiodinium sp. CCMP2592]